MKKLPDGKYLARCKERSAISAAVNGHGAVYPQALCTIANGVAMFEKDGRRVWDCNAAYAQANFQLETVK